MAESRVSGPYLQVMRMHVVIIAFSALHAAQRESFAAFAAIYALYFFPWRLMREKFGAEKAAAGALYSHGRIATLSVCGTSRGRERRVVAVRRRMTTYVR